MKLVKDVFFGAVGYMFGRRRRLRMPGDVFRRKLVITIHPWGVPVLALALALPLVFKFSYIVNAVELAVVATSIILVWRMSHIVNGLKYEVWHLLHGISEADEDDRYQAWMDKPADDIPRVPLKRMNGQRSTRVPKSS